MKGMTEGGKSEDARGILQGSVVRDGVFLVSSFTTFPFADLEPFPTWTSASPFPAVHAWEVDRGVSDARVAMACTGGNAAGAGGLPHLDDALKIRRQARGAPCRFAV